ELCGTKSEGRNHVPGDPATETTPQTCTVCGYELAPIITHTHVGNLHQGTNPTCTSEGIKDYYECKCGKFFEDQACTKEIANVNTWKIIPKDTTKHDFSKEFKKENADKDKHYHVCTRCGAKDSGEAHTPGAKATETTPQTCTKCGYEISPKVAHTHNPGVHKGFAATCTKAGEKDYYVCTCGKYFTDKSCTAEITNLNSWKVIPALGHNFTTSYTKENADNSKHYHVCTRCGAKDAGVAHTPGPAATDHSTQNCTVCGRVLAGALLHEHKGELHKGYAATCQKNGEKDFYICKCGLVFEDAACKKEIAVLDSWKVIPATGHTYDKEYLEKNADANYHYHVCTQCGAKDAGQPHAPGAAATADKDQTCNVCGKVLAKATGNDTKKEEETPKEPETPKQEETKKEEEVKPATPTTPEVEKEDDGVLNVGFGIALGAGVAIIGLVIYRRLIKKPLR
ncbi:MAG: hypothetical protein HUJ56_13630, partial [Erysipelotrichaceae bacterium]|nr:hypothetical protein [Erysipelotrichaceae bacterium]